MEYLTKFHKLITYTDKNMISYNRKSISVFVYAKAVLSEELAYSRNYPCSEVFSDPILIEVRIPLSDMVESDEEILISGECLAQIAAISPDFLNLFGTRKGVNIVELLLVSSQSMLKRFIEFDDCGVLSDFSYKCLKWNALYFYGAVTRDIKSNDLGWVLPFLNKDKDKDENQIATYKISHSAISKALHIFNRSGRFFLTRAAIKDFLALPQIFTNNNIEITRPFRAASKVFNNELKEPFTDSLLNPKNPNEKAFLVSSGAHRLRMIVAEDNSRNKTTNVVVRIAPFLAKEITEEYRINGTDQRTNAIKIEQQFINRQQFGAEGKLG